MHDGQVTQVNSFKPLRQPVRRDFCHLHPAGGRTEAWRLRGVATGTELGTDGPRKDTGPWLLERAPVRTQFMLSSRRCKYTAWAIFFVSFYFFSFLTHSNQTKISQKFQREKENDFLPSPSLSKSYFIMYSTRKIRLLKLYPEHL